MTFAIVFLALYLVVKFDIGHTRQAEQEAMAVAVTKGKQECQKEGQRPEICESIKGYVTTSECLGERCWIVHTNAADLSVYGAGMIVRRENGTYVTSEYIRNRPLNTQ